MDSVDCAVVGLAKLHARWLWRHSMRSATSWPRFMGWQTAASESLQGDAENSSALFAFDSRVIAGIADHVFGLIG